MKRFWALAVAFILVLMAGCSVNKNTNAADSLENSAQAEDTTVSKTEAADSASESQTYVSKTQKEKTESAEESAKDDSSSEAPEESTAEITVIPESSESKETTAPESTEPETTGEAETTKETTSEKSSEELGYNYADYPDLTGKTIYLTYDDGPSDLTEKLLDILDKYNVKATFFVCNQTGARLDLLKRMVDSGHEVGIHSYSHDYYTKDETQNIYFSFENWKKDFDKMYNLVHEVTGYWPKYYRFPGGSYGKTCNVKSNKDSFNQVVEYLNSLGVTYVDWNVSADGGDSTLSSATVINNIFFGQYSNVSKYSSSIVLCHDISSMKNSVYAMDQIIDIMIHNGATLKRMEASAVYQFNISFDENGKSVLN